AAVRTMAGGLVWQTADHHGTAQLSIKSTDLSVTRRKFEPYGNPRGSQPTWPATHGFGNGFFDPPGLTHLGAREYEPSTGRFISVDPVLDFANPQQTGGYVYGGSNPPTNTDPDGTCYSRAEGDLCSGNTRGLGAAPHVQGPPSPPGGSD